MAVEFNKLFVSFMFIGLMVFAILSLTFSMQTDNEVENKVANNELMGETFESLEEDLSGLRSTSQTQKNIFEEENPTAGLGSILLFSIVSAGKVFNGMIVGIFNMMVKLPVAFLGVDAVLVSVLGTILIISIIIGLWQIYKLGS